MNNTTSRVFDEKTLSQGDTMSEDEALDYGAFSTLDVVIHVSSAATGDSPTLTLKHASYNEAGRYLAFESPVEVSLSATGSTWFRVSAFSRFIGWSLAGTLDTPAVVTLDIVAR